MQTSVVKIDPLGQDLPQIREAAAIVDAGGLVVFPTETVYGIACRVSRDSLTRLDLVKGRTADKRYTLHIGPKGQVGQFVPRICLKARKLVQGAWPGPVTIIFVLESQDLEVQRKALPEEVFGPLYRDAAIGVRCPGHAVATRLLELTQHPVIAPSANLQSHPPATDAQQALDALAGKVDMVLDAGPCQYKQSSTVVRPDPRGLEVLREGVYSRAQLDRISRIQVLFVCTGNTCRSAMAEGLFRWELSQRLRSSIDDLGRMGYIVRSAGIMNLAGMPASTGAMAACAEKGVDLQGHRSSLLTAGMIRDSDWIFAMEHRHREAVLSLVPQAADRCILLDPAGDIQDPVGQPIDVFHRCARQIHEAIERRISELVL